MALIEHIPLLRQLHVGLAVASVSLFITRSGAVLAGARWPMRGAWRGASVGIDTLLITAGGLLWWTLSLHPGRQGWLGTKLALIVLYIVLGSLAMKRAPGRAAKVACFAAALLTIAAVAAIALARDASAPLRWLGLAGLMG